VNVDRNYFTHPLTSLASSDRKVESHGINGALDMLRKAADDISLLVSDVDSFANWWVMAEAMLSSVQSHVEQLRADKISIIRVKGVRSEWAKIKEEYLDYKINVRVLDHSLDLSYSMLNWEHRLPNFKIIILQHGNNCCWRRQSQNNQASKK
jgi:hypothetical protein